MKASVDLRGAITLSIAQVNCSLGRESVVPFWIWYGRVAGMSLGLSGSSCPPGLSRSLVVLQSLQQSQQAGGHVPVHRSLPFGYGGSVTCTHVAAAKPGWFCSWACPHLPGTAEGGHRHLVAMCDWSCSLLRQTMSWMLSV